MQKRRREIESKFSADKDTPQQREVILASSNDNRRRIPLKMKRNGLASLSSPEKKVKQLTVILERLNSTVLAELMGKKVINYPFTNNYGIAYENSSADKYTPNQSETTVSRGTTSVSLKRQRQTATASSDGKSKSRRNAKLHGRSEDETVANVTQRFSKRLRKLAKDPSENDALSLNSGVQNTKETRTAAKRFQILDSVSSGTTNSPIVNFSADKNNLNKRKQPFRETKRISIVQENVVHKKVRKMAPRINYRKQLEAKIVQKSPSNEYLEGEIVLGTIPGHAPWPATILKIMQETIYIQFFGTGQVNPVRLNAIRRFEVNRAIPLLERKGFRKAMRELEMSLGIPASVSIFGMNKL